jgi:dimethylamine monooxygenase subunit A
MSPPRHTPYDGSNKLFQIGLKPLDPADWIDVDEDLATTLDEKDLLGAAHFADVFAAEDGSEAAQAEVLAMLAAHLADRFPEVYRRLEDRIEMAGRTVELGATPALWTAARLVQEDLLLMRRGESDWRLAAAALCFPSSWTLADKIGRPIHEIHGPVPGFGAGTRPAELIARMFDTLRPAVPVLRWNWSLYGDAELFHPHASHPEGRFGSGARAETVFFRVERQTLRKLPVSGDILFTVRIYLDPIAALETHPDAAAIAVAVIGQIEALTPEQAAYKGLSLERDRLVARLREIAQPA